ncbi:MAG: glucose-1-phosphate cytidylyltransferase [Dehalococcoidia bacterium]|nr:glucose-1-phosphate cytidylyltransferase [Dehalococcoidia bacterium]
MKVAILAGGTGTRLAEETVVRPKPLVEIGNMPILWHVMTSYAQYGFREFVVALGYKGDQIKRYWADYCLLGGSITVDLAEGGIDQAGERPAEDWVVRLIETGEKTGSGGRVKRLSPYLGQETFMLTYTDGLADIDLARLLEFHKKHGRLATLTAVRPPGRFGHLDIVDGRVESFLEKPRHEQGWINGGFFVVEPGVFDYIDGDSDDWAGQILTRLAEDGQLMAYQHESFWQCMDTIQEKNYLDALWQSGNAPWKGGEISPA